MNSEPTSLSRSIAEEHRASFDLKSATWDRISELIRNGETFSRFAPEEGYAVDPRDQGITLFNHRRAKRPHDYTPSSDATGRGAPSTAPQCPICAGTITPIIDMADLHEGYTFLNTNLYPIIAPPAGAHFLQWTSSNHDTDWPELTPSDRTVVMERLAALEKTLLKMPGFPEGPDGRIVSIIKNVGRSVGGSLSHGHQQIVLSGVMPRRVRENLDYSRDRGTPFSRTLLETTPRELVVAELDRGTLVVPPYMRRPYDMLFLLHNSEPSQLHELSPAELSSLAEGFSLGMCLMRSVLLSLGREIAYNVLIHTGPGAGIYLEFLPWTQENGGYEQLGLNACQGVPQEATRVLREFL